MSYAEEMLKANLVIAAALSTAAFVLLGACAGPSIDGQGDSCDTVADCLPHQGFECIARTDGTGSHCEVPCDPTTPDSGCPLDESCSDDNGYGQPVCFPQPA